MGRPNQAQPTPRAQKRLRQARFADAGFPFDQHKLRRCQLALQLGQLGGEACEGQKLGIRRHKARRGQSQRRVGLLGFREFVNLRLTELVEKGLEVFDLEDDVRCFTGVLPRVRIIPIDEFDPVRFL